MSYIVAEGRVPLQGTVTIGGAKNAALPILAATLLTADECYIENVPQIQDVLSMADVLAALGAELRWVDGNTLLVRAAALTTPQVPNAIATRMRGSFLVVGPLLARFGQAEAPHPGGCAIGTRPVSVDLKGFQSMGAQVERQNGSYRARAPHLWGERISLDYPSHTGTENLLMAAALARGTTIIENASVEPEVVDLAHFLNSLGARVYGAGTGIIQVEGVEKLHGTAFRVMPDRLEAGTFALGAAITAGTVVMDAAVAPYLGALTSKLQEAGVDVRVDAEHYVVRTSGALKAVDIQTFPYPGFPTDLQAPFAVMMTQAEGESSIHETMYDDRLHYVEELRKMGARIKVRGQTAIVQGPTPLRGAGVRALDIRSGAAVVLAALAAEGRTLISDVHYIERGYQGIEVKLAALGAHISYSDSAAEAPAARPDQSPAASSRGVQTPRRDAPAEAQPGALTL
ncbi:MAG TPA: UDP-N-acetylglucosamine 1-carboxyvinyltransferase [Anaerolineae bacterium]|nr:UDP-N-acetylglucosamine 1-carboxyvinyltransferase [Anaerolineae bacterium]HOR00735.1 UDP-N-acetylglucosamine 1-carboxyvinyltransferase [Anaerolineae bacterium]